MRFAGIDLGWSGAPSGLAVMSVRRDRLQLEHLSRPDSHQAVLDQLPSGSCFAAVDAPLIITNTAGMRSADRLAHSLFSRHHAGAYPIHLQMPIAQPLVAFSASLKTQSFSLTIPRAPQHESRHAFEVYPNAAMVRLFSLDRILPYKKGPLSQRRDGLATFRNLLGNALAQRRPSFQSAKLPEVPTSGKDLKACEDMLDAILCAYIAAHYWYWGLARNNILGDESTGFIVNPSF
jgi:predicted RNase H-like nuclease